MVLSLTGAVGGNPRGHSRKLTHVNYGRFLWLLMPLSKQVMTVIQRTLIAPVAVLSSPMRLVGKIETSPTYECGQTTQQSWQRSTAWRNKTLRRSPMICSKAHPESMRIPCRANWPMWFPVGSPTFSIYKVLTMQWTLLVPRQWRLCSMHADCYKHAKLISCLQVQQTGPWILQPSLNSARLVRYLRPIPRLSMQAQTGL